MGETMNRYKNYGWHNESERHSLAAKGIKTGKQIKDIKWEKESSNCIKNTQREFLESSDYEFGDNFKGISLDVIFTKKPHGRYQVEILKETASGSGEILQTYETSSLSNAKKKVEEFKKEGEKIIEKYNSRKHSNINVNKGASSIWSSLNSQERYDILGGDLSDNLIEYTGKKVTQITKKDLEDADVWDKVAGRLLELK